MGALREQMDQDMVLRGFSERTRESYLAAVAAMAKFYRRSPDRIEEQEVQRYLLHLREKRKLSVSTCNQVHCVTKLQRMLGHSNVTTTMRYLHVTAGRIATHRSPLDQLGLCNPNPNCRR